MKNKLGPGNLKVLADLGFGSFFHRVVKPKTQLFDLFNFRVLVLADACLLLLLFKYNIHKVPSNSLVFPGHELTIHDQDICNFQSLSVACALICCKQAIGISVILAVVVPRARAS